MNSVHKILHKRIIFLLTVSMAVILLIGCNKDDTVQKKESKQRQTKSLDKRKITNDKKKTEDKPDLIIINTGYPTAAVQVSKTKKSIGTYREEEIVDDTVTIVNERLVAGQYGEAAIKKLIERQEGKVGSYSIQKDDYLCETMSYPVYKVSYQTVDKNEPISNRDIVVQTDDWDLRYHTAVSIDFAESYYDIIDEWMKSLTLYDRKQKNPDGIDTNQVIGGYINADGSMWVQLEEDPANGPYLAYKLEGDNIVFVTDKIVTKNLEQGKKGRHCFLFKATKDGKGRIKLYYTKDHEIDEAMKPDFIFDVKTNASKITSMNMIKPK